MAEKDPSARLRRAVKENNLFLVKRLIQRTDMRNIDPSPRRYTSLAWAAVSGNEETFEFLLDAGHDDEELSKDAENNTILMLLADTKPPPLNSYAAQVISCEDMSGAFLRMARSYYDRYSWILDWSNAQGKTALHIASLKGNEELVRMFCDLGADFDLADNQGNTPLHYASAWGHIPIVQLLIERGCQYSARNNEGFTASDYAYSISTRDTLQDSARMAFENNKKTRRNVFAQAAERGHERGRTSPPDVLMPPVPQTIPDDFPRMRSGSGTSRSTNTQSEAGDADIHSLLPGSHGRSTHSTSSSPPHHPMAGSLGPPLNASFALSPIANRMRERDADAREKYLLRNRSGSQGTSSTDHRSLNGSKFTSAGPAANGDDITPLTPVSLSGVSTPKRLRPSVSAAQLRTPGELTELHPSHGIRTHNESRNRAGTGPTTRPVNISFFTRSSSTSTSPRQGVLEEPESYLGPPSQFAQFPDPPAQENVTVPTTRRKAFPFISKPPSMDPYNVIHRRGMSVASARGPS